MKNTLIAVCALLAMAATAGADTYYNGPYDEGTGTNVIDSSVTLSSPTFIGRLSPGITNSVLVTSTGTMEQTDKLYVGYSNVADGTTGLLKVQGTMTSASGTAIFGWGAGGAGTLEIDGGDVTMAGLSTGRDSSTGIVTINGGSLTVNGAVFGYQRATNTNSAMSQTGGAVDFNGDVRIGLDGNATYSISGGSLEMNGMYLGVNGTGRFDVVGSGASSIVLNGTLSLVSGYNLWVGNGATFGFTVDAGGVTSIVADNARLDGGVIDMAIAAGVTVANNTTLTLLTIDAAVQGSMNNLSLAAGDEYIAGVQSGWVLQNDGSTLQARYIGPSDSGPPVADAGDDVGTMDSDGNGTETVTLDGTGSSDDVGIVSYVWKESGATIATGATANVSLTPGRHDIQLTVTDGVDNVATDVVRIWIAPKADYYVDTNHASASDNNPGTAALPFKTVTKGVSVAAAGKVTWFARGFIVKRFRRRR